VNAPSADIDPIQRLFLRCPDNAFTDNILCGELNTRLHDPSQGVE
jgi:hypothetical protein